MNTRLIGGLSAAAMAALLVLAGCGGSKGSGAAVTTTADGYKQVTQIEMTLQWKVQGDSLDVIVKSPAKGWVGVGFDPETIMKGASIIIGYVDAAGQAVVKDHFADQLITHKPDTELGGTDDVTLVSGEETAEGTTLHFTIPLDSGDQRDIKLTAGEKHKIMLAYGTADDDKSPHAKTHRAVFEVEL